MFAVGRKLPVNIAISGLIEWQLMGKADVLSGTIKIRSKLP